MRVAFLTRYPPAHGSTRVRVTHYLPFFERAGIEVRTLTWSVTTRRSLAMFAARALRLARWADVVVLQKPTQSPRLVDALARANSHLVVDFDDAVWTPVHDAEFDHEKYGARLRHAIGRAHVVTCGSEYLARWARTVRPDVDVDVIPPAVDPARYEVPARRGGEDPPTVGWIGSASAFPDFSPPVVEALRSLVTSGRARLLTVTSRPPDPIAAFSDFAEWSPEREVELLGTFDIGIMPLRDTERSRGRCGYKAIQYMAVAAPVVASPFGALDTVEDGETGFWASDRSSWEARLGALVDDPDLRWKLGSNGRRRVEERFTLHGTAPRFVAALVRADTSA